MSLPRSKTSFLCFLHEKGGWLTRSMIVLAILFCLLAVLSWKGDLYGLCAALIGLVFGLTAAFWREWWVPRRLEAVGQEAQEQLRAYREMVESANDGLLLIEDRLIVGCNPAAERLFGFEQKELIGRHPGSLSPDPAPIERADGLLDAALAGETQRFMWLHKRKDGSLFTVEVTLNPAVSVKYPGQPETKRFVAVLRDVTEREQSAQALKESERRFRELFEFAPIPLVMVSSDSSLYCVNRQWLSIVGYTIEDVPDIEHWWIRVYPDPVYRAECMARWGRSLAEAAKVEEIRPEEYRVLCKDGTIRHMLIGGVVVGEGLIASFQDVSERHEAQVRLEELNSSLETRVQERTKDLEAAIEHLKQTQNELVRTENLAALGALVAGVSHELNTPIGNALMMATSLRERHRDFGSQMSNGLRRSDLDGFVSDGREATEIIERNLQRAADLIRSFKQLSVDQTSSNRRNFDLADVLHELRMSLSPTLRRSHVEIIDDVGPGLLMDSLPGPLTQVLMNLVNNAVVHAFEGREGGKILVSARPLGEDKISLTVKDDGKGIPSEDLPKVFDPFFTTRLGRGGSGLGLHIVYSLVTELLGGEVRMESHPGEGSLVTIELPRSAPKTRES